MFKRKKYLLNCDVCDTRKMKEEEYSHYEQIMINADVVIVSESSKSMLNRLPVTINHDKMVEIADDIEAVVKTVNGFYEITGNTSAAEHTILIVNGNLMIESGTEEILKNYEEIVVNGSVKYPKSLDGFLNKMTINGSARSYPDDCMIMDSEFTMDKYFPLRAKEGSKYYAESIVIIKDKNVDIAKLTEKKVQFITKKLIVPECKIEDSASVFDEQVEFIVVPDGMELVYGDSTLNEALISKEGGRLFVYGNVELDANEDMNALCTQLEKLVVTGSVTMQKEQEAAFKKIDAEYAELIIAKNNRKMTNVPRVKLDKSLFDNSPEGITVSNVAKVVIAKDVTPEMILEKLTVMNCAMISCNDEQESTVAAVATNVGKIGKSFENENGMDDIVGVIKGLADTKLINADSYVM